MSSTLQWLGRTTLALLVVVGLPQFADAAFIDPVSQSYLIHAWGSSVPPGEPVVVDYTETSSTPINRFDSVPVYLPSGGQVGLFVLSTATDSGITSSSAFVQAQSSFDSSGAAAVGPAQATATITFRPLVTDMIVQAGFPGLGFNFGYGSLHDDTADVALLTLAPFLTPAAYNISFDLAHVYSISASSGNGGPPFSHGARISIVPGPASVPESGSTLTFFVVGLGALLLVARSPKFRSSN